MPSDLAIEAARLQSTRGSMTPVEASGFIVYRLMSGDRLSPAFIAALTGLDRRHVWQILDEVSRMVPIYNEDGTWMLLPP